jgi:hypothetical protein
VLAAPMIDRPVHRDSRSPSGRTIATGCAMRSPTALGRPVAHEGKLLEISARLPGHARFWLGAPRPGMAEGRRLRPAERGSASDRH